MARLVECEAKLGNAEAPSSRRSARTQGRTSTPRSIRTSGVTLPHTPSLPARHIAYFVANRYRRGHAHNLSPICRARSRAHEELEVSTCERPVLS